jgi:hypothetical protein
MVTLRNVLEDWNCFEESLSKMGKNIADYPQASENMNNLCSTFAEKSGFADLSDALRKISLDEELDKELQNIHCELLKTFVEIAQQSLRQNKKEQDLC